MNKLEHAIYAHLVGQHGFHADLVETKVGSALNNTMVIGETGRSAAVADDNTVRRHTCSGKNTLLLISENAVGVGNDGRTCCHRCMSRSKQNWQTAIQVMTLAGAVPTCTESVLFQLLGVAGTEEFKKLSKLVR